ncbi:hypothetical protein CHU98_g10815 [Xylaria longipes]|nr:hypothetical protein CHU98_g10815 [Xylaria longipes]
MILPNISPPFRELLQKTPNPFVTKIRDAIYTTATFSKGKVVLVGDAFATLRPHIGAATEQAAFHGNTLESVYRGDKPQQVWDTEIQATTTLGKPMKAYRGSRLRHLYAAKRLHCQKSKPQQRFFTRD